ncbi:hypothetical protein [Paenilisteria rocourtiae]|uniref:Uncharacterized protein n=1 Tax=Listeria rocourtiae TaxID=647910 RepID=A0A4R6ZHS1_9LIST|nr:hypothetical protein [Listeria rocourtiae]EUJ46695.1 hypothetical protein PROCOU_11288 [Listeria rocourtiae FSL F6-920]TDR51705.1 hypothetical protein DFP96_11111 [Listeria rocourtiae]
MTESQIIMSEINRTVNRTGQQLANKIIKSDNDLDNLMHNLESLTAKMKESQKAFYKARLRENELSLAKV